MLKKLIKLFLYRKLGKKHHYKYSSSDYKYHKKGGYHHYGHNHYKKKHSSFSFFSS